MASTSWRCVGGNPLAKAGTSRCSPVGILPGVGQEGIPRVWLGGVLPGVGQEGIPRVWRAPLLAGGGLRVDSRSSADCAGQGRWSGRPGKTRRRRLVRCCHGGGRGGRKLVVPLGGRFWNGRPASWRCGLKKKDERQEGDPPLSLVETEPPASRGAFSVESEEANLG